MTITHAVLTTRCNCSTGDVPFCLHTNLLQLLLYEDSYHT